MSTEDIMGNKYYILNIIKYNLEDMYLLLVSLTAVAVSVARSKTPTTGFVIVPTTPFPNPAKKPWNYLYIQLVYYFYL